MLKSVPQNIIFAAGFLLICTVFIKAQTDVQPDLNAILKNAGEKTQNYREEFKNLLAVETKTFEIFDKNGNSKKNSVVESNFIIFQSAKDQSIASEYRDVYKVDGKVINDNTARANSLLAELAKSNSVKQELEKIQKESLRYDKNLEITGLTLFQSPILEEYNRQYFDFKAVGRETFNNSDVYVIEYQQTKQSPYVLINDDKNTTKKLSLSFDLDLPKSLDKSKILLRGKFLIDAKTFQIWREERELYAQTEIPVVILKTEFEYQPSEFGILVPKQINLIQYRIKKAEKEGQISAVKDTQVDFTYSKFKKANSEVQIIEEN